MIGGFHIILLLIFQTLFFLNMRDLHLTPQKNDYEWI